MCNICLLYTSDNPITVSKIAKIVGVKNYDKYIDMSTVSDDTDLKDIVLNYTIFGRVSPTQKQSLIKSLKDNGRTVAMTGDGVNDVLALKEADCSVAMASGSAVSYTHLGKDFLRGKGKKNIRLSKNTRDYKEKSK